MKLWEHSASIDPSLPSCIAILPSLTPSATDQRSRQGHRAVGEATSVGGKYAMHFAELDEKLASASVSPEKRLAALEQNSEVVLKRDDSLSRSSA